MHVRGIIWILALLCMIYGLGMLVTACVALGSASRSVMMFGSYGAVLVLLAGAVSLFSGPAPKHLTHRDGFLMVSLAWLLLSLLGAVPFVISGVSHTFGDAMFESVSGLTTTGATVLTGLDATDPAILFWRSMQQWLGGIGIVVLVVAVIPFLGAGGMQLLKAEVPGPVKDKLTSRVSQTAKALWGIYVGLTLACTLAYWWAGMSVFDAVNHAMSTLSTGGFSTHDASFGYYRLPALHIIAIVFMLAASVNFSLHFAVAHRGFSLRHYFLDDEFKFYILVLSVLTLLIAWVALPLPESSWDEVVFSAVSVITTTGFTVGDYSLWPSGCILLLLLMMLTGACAGSTSGGMKLIRVLLLFRHVRRELHRLIHPHGVMQLRIGDHTVPQGLAESLWGFAVLYFFSFFIVAVIVALSGVDILTSLSASAACLSNTGPGFGDVGPAGNYAALPDVSKWVLMLAMVVGRLEIYTFFVLFIPEFWRK